MAIRCADHQYLYCYSFNQVCLVHSPHMVSSLSGPVQCACGRCHELQVLTQCGPTLDGYVGESMVSSGRGIPLHSPSYCIGWAHYSFNQVRLVPLTTAHTVYMVTRQYYKHAACLYTYV